MITPLHQKILALFKEEHNKENIIFEVFEHQYQYNPIYRQFVDLVSSKKEIKEIHQIPHLPIQFFKRFQIKTGEWTPEYSFKSSGTTGQIRSQHLVKSLAWYHQMATLCFEHTFGPLQDKVILALLPNYIEQGNSSLVSMVDHFIHQSGNENSGFYLNNLEALKSKLQWCKKEDLDTIIFGVSYALLDFVAQYEIELPSRCMLIETGGMKGRKKEMTRESLHRELIEALKIPRIYSEYGMTELFSQAYTDGSKWFESAPTMICQTREMTDPFGYSKVGKAGALNVIDLANLDTCSFIATDDVAIKNKEEKFDVLGRLDGSEMRGCSLMYTED